MPAFPSASSRLTQVISNLVGNALKFSPDGSRVVITTGSGEGGEVWLSVQDEGRGISPDFLPHVFDRLRQEDGSRTRKAGGLGLGLAITRAIVARHGWTLHLDSEMGKGTTFRLRMPVPQHSEIRAAE